MKILLSMDERLVKRIDRAAASMGMSRSAFIANVAARELDSRDGPGASPTTRRAIGQLNQLFNDNPRREERTAAVRAARDARGHPPG